MIIKGNNGILFCNILILKRISFNKTISLNTRAVYFTLTSKSKAIIQTFDWQIKHYKLTSMGSV